MSSSATIACLCKGVRATVTGTDKGPVVCHCRNCREVTGSAFAHNHRFMNAKMEFEKGEELVKCYDDGATKSGSVLGRCFCSNCGSCLFIKGTIDGVFVLHCGTIEGELSRQPKFELFEEDKREWLGKLSAPKL